MDEQVEKISEIARGICDEDGSRVFAWVVGARVPRS
jgi:hypothetical protein